MPHVPGHIDDSFDIDPFVSARDQKANSERALLEAIATAGTEGRKAFTGAKKANEAAQQAAIQRALQRERIAGLGGASIEGRDAIQQTFGRLGSALEGSQARFLSGLQGTQASGQSFLEKVAAAEGLQRSQNEDIARAREQELEAAIALAEQQRQEQLAAELRAEQRQIRKEQRADARAGQASAGKFPLDEIIGATVRTAEQANKDLEPLLADFQREQGLFDRETKRLQDVFTGLRAVEDQMRSPAFAALRNVDPERAGGLARRRDRLQNEAATLQRRLPLRQQKIQDLAPRVAQLQGVAQNPNITARQIGEQAGFDANLVAGKLSKVKFRPIFEAIGLGESVAPKKFDNQVVALANKTKVKGGKAIVEKILGNSTVQNDIRDFTSLAASGENTFKEVEDALREEYLPNKDRTFKVLRELLRDLPWKKG